MANMREKILLSKEGLEEYKASLQELIEKLGALYEKVSKGLYSMEDIADEEAKLLKKISERREMISRVEIVESHNRDEYVDINEIVTVEFSQNDSYTFTLVAGKANSEEDEISINSPLGRAVYNKKVNDVCTYLVGKNEISVTITTIETPTKDISLTKNIK